MSNKTISTTYFVQAMLKRFASKKYLPSRSQLAHDLYTEYKAKLSAPRLTPANVSKVMLYMQKHDLPKKDLAKVIKKVVPSSTPILAERDFYQMLGQSHLYDSSQPVMANLHGYAMRKQDVRDLYQFFISGIKSSLISGFNLRLSGLGTFVCTKRKATTYHNPQNGKPVPKPARLAATFRPSQALKRALAKQPVKEDKP